MFFLLLLSLLCCTHNKTVKTRQTRLGVPFEALTLFDIQKDPSLEKFRIITLKPEERVKNLEVLLFSTKSSAFDGIVVSARTAPVLKKWASYFPNDWKSRFNKGVADLLSDEKGIYALPINLDFPVFVYLKDSFNGLPEPKNLGFLRNNLRILQAKGKTKLGLVSTVSEEVLFVSLLSSERGIPPEKIYDYHSVKLMEFFKEFSLSQLKIHQVEWLFSNGNAVSAFVKLSECPSFIENLKKQGFSVAAEPLPCTLK
ncbi:MAG: hypothetical protein N2445_00440, partial [Acidobacteria bacterium]|nr:hypothetical protein [Acidobacteriota bacterium]